MDNVAYDYSNGTDPPSGKSVPTNYTGAQNGVSLQRVLSVDREVEERRAAERSREPLRYCKWIVSYPKTMFCVLFGLALFLVLVTFALMAMGYDIIPIVFERLPLDIRDNDYYLRGLSWQHRNEDDDIYERGADSGPQEPRSQLREAITFLYEKKGGNVLTKERLKAIQDHEEKFWSDRKFQKDMCYLINGDCAKPRSIIQFFNGDYWWADERFYDPYFDNITRIINLANTVNETKQALEFFLPNKYTLTPERVEASIIRTSPLAIGWPLEGFDYDDEDEDEQQDEVDKWLFDDFIDKGQKYFDDGVRDMDFYYSSFSTFSVYVINQAYKDMSLLVGSLAFIFLFMWFQTRTLFITGFAVGSIVTSFFIANMIYRVVLDYRYFGFFHVLALFIILGIGADDVFVFFDTWKETSFYKFPSLAHRLSYAYRRAAMAMLWTSLTTAVAFIVSATSPFIGVNTFGVFAGLLVFVNYMSVILFLPTAIIIYHLYFEKFRCCCCCQNKTAPTTGETVPVHEEKGIVVRFFADYYFRFITHKIIRWVILLFYGALLAVFLYFASKIEVQNEQIEFLPTDTNFGGFSKKLNDKFSSGDTPVRVFIVWGLEEQDVDGCHRSDGECFGDTVWDDDFKIESERQQQALLEFCETIRDLPKKQLEDLHIKINVVTNEPEVYCFPMMMKNFLEEEQSRVVYDPARNTTTQRYLNGTELTYPITEDVAMTIMDNTDWVYTSDLDGDYDRWFEIGMAHWLHGGFESPVLDFTYNNYEPFMGVSTDRYTKKSDATRDYPERMPYSYYYGTKLRYAAIVVNTTIRAQTLGFIDGIPIRDDWEDFVSKEIKKMPKGLQKGYQCTPIDFEDFDLWHWMDIQRTLVSSAVTGIVVGLACALPVLIIATGNIVVGVMATTNIAIITATVIGFIPMMDWKLGFMESLNLVLVVGLAVDYCVHLAEGYSRSTHYDRKGRVHDALQEVGISVVSGCITTIGASSFMLFAVISFFTQFGSFLFATLGFSFIYSIGLFTTCLGIFGPEGDFGSLRVVCGKLCGCFPCFKKTNKADITSNNVV